MVNLVRLAVIACDAMKAPEHFEVMPGYCCCRLSGHGSLEDVASRVIETLSFSREQGTEKLLVDATNWTGYESPTVADRFYIGSDFAKAAGPRLKFALVVPSEIMHPRKFGVTVAINRWTDANVFDSEKEALAWLLSE